MFTIGGHRRKEEESVVVELPKANYNAYNRNLDPFAVRLALPPMALLSA
jgi:hypothetical protein